MSLITLNDGRVVWQVEAPRTMPGTKGVLHILDVSTGHCERVIADGSEEAKNLLLEVKEEPHLFTTERLLRHHDNARLSMTYVDTDIGLLQRLPSLHNDQAERVVVAAGSRVHFFTLMLPTS